ncbi:hypothetical protein BH11BAC3_BH11BAC3_15480 [soil metagenome]
MKIVLKCFVIVLCCIPSIIRGQINTQKSKAKEPSHVYNVYDFGAKGNGLANDQKAIQKAINTCGKTGGIVLLKKGKFLTGQLELVSNITLQIDSSAVVLGIQSDKEEDYPHGVIETNYPNRMLEDCQRRLIYGNRVAHVTITGGGTINGQGKL